MNIFSQEAPAIGKKNPMCTQLPDESLCAARHVKAQLVGHDAQYAALAETLRNNPAHGVLTVTRGSANHTAAYLATMVMSRTGQLVTTLPASLLKLYRAPLASHGLLAIAIARSAYGQDLVDTLQVFRRAGAMTVALTNEADSPLAQAVEWSMPLQAGKESSVSKPRDFICGLVAAARLSAHWPWGAHRDFRAALLDLPAALEHACQQDWSAAVEALQAARRVSVIGFGAGLAIAKESALQLREVCGMAAEAFSAGELEHTPLTRLDSQHIVLVWAPRGPAQSGLIELAADLRLRGARVLLAAPADVASRTLTLTRAPHRDLDPICGIQSFYLLLETVVRVRALASFMCGR
jgi:glucosamine--fructose-6-phosphate aminotransferase (isomerizing)